MTYYSLKFTLLFRYAQKIVVEPMAWMSKFVLDIFESMVKEYRSSILIEDMDISKLVTHAQQIKKENIYKKETKRAKRGNFDYSQ